MKANLENHITTALAAGERKIALDAAMIGKLTDAAGAFAVNLMIALIILAVTLVASSWAAAVTRRALSRMRVFRRDPTVLTFASQVVRVIVLVIGLVAVLRRLGVETTSIIAMLGAASLALGLALQGTLSNVAAGVMLLILRPYRVGDLISVKGNVGKVQKLDLFTTQLIDANNVKIVVPNKLAFDDTILNLSGQKTRRMELKIGVGYDSNLNQVREVLIRAVSAIPEVQKEPPPWVGVTDLLDSSVQVTLQAWTLSGDYWQARADVFQAVKEALDGEGIEIPFPHQVLVSSSPNTAAAQDEGAAAPPKSPAVSTDGAAADHGKS